MEELGCAWSFDKLDLEQSSQRRKTDGFLCELNILVDFHWLIVEGIKNKQTMHLAKSCIM